jgi:hypothetical protein
VVEFLLLLAYRDTRQRLNDEFYLAFHLFFRHIRVSMMEMATYISADTTSNTSSAKDANLLH